MKATLTFSLAEPPDRPMANPDKAVLTARVLAVCDKKLLRFIFGFVIVVLLVLAS
jgi:hypothetical protein